MSLINDASLILTPNSVKEGKLYSIIPTNGNGDMTVVRATATATRTNELGLIEPTPYNLLEYSENFANVVWSKSNVNVTLNQGIAPNNTNTVNKITVDNTSNVHFIRQIVTQTTGTKTLSFFVDKTQNRYVACSLIFGNNSNGGGIIVDTLTQTIVSSNFSGATFSVNYITIGNFLRISLTVTNTIENIIDRAHISPYNNEPYTWQINAKLPSYTGDGISSLFVWGAQLVQGSVPKDYFYTTDRLNVPRLNYDSVGGCPSILVEPQRTNLLLNSVWAGGGATPTSWTTGFQTGTSTPVASIKNPNVSAYRFVTSNTRQEFQQTFSLILNQVIAFSCYVESATTAIPVIQMLRIGPVATANGTVVFLKNNVVITSTTNVEAGFTYSAVLTCTVAGDFQFRIGSGVNSNITGDITISMPQVELGTGSPSITSYSTSFIPTTIQTITRNADLITRNNIYTNGLITSLGGTWFIELNNNLSLTRDISGNGIWIGDTNTSSTAGNSLNIRHNGGTARLIINKTVANVLTPLYTTLTNTVKIAIDWNGTTADVFVNGVKVLTATSFTTTNMEFLNSSANDVQKYIKSMMLFPKPLTDAECIALTSYFFNSYLDMAKYLNYTIQ